MPFWGSDVKIGRGPGRAGCGALEDAAFVFFAQQIALAADLRIEIGPGQYRKLGKRRSRRSFAARSRQNCERLAACWSRLAI